MTPRKAAPPAARPDPITREIRSAIADSGLSPYAIARAAGVDEAAVRRFLSRERSLSLDSADRLAETLGLKLVRKAAARKGRPAPPTTPDPET